MSNSINFSHKELDAVAAEIILDHGAKTPATWFVISIGVGLLWNLIEVASVPVKPALMVSIKAQEWATRRRCLAKLTAETGAYASVFLSHALVELIRNEPHEGMSLAKRATEARLVLRHALPVRDRDADAVLATLTRNDDRPQTSEEPRVLASRYALESALGAETASELPALRYSRMSDHFLKVAAERLGLVWGNAQSLFAEFSAEPELWEEFKQSAGSKIIGNTQEDGDNTSQPDKSEGRSDEWMIQDIPSIRPGWGGAITCPRCGTDSLVRPATQPEIIAVASGNLNWQELDPVSRPGGKTGPPFLVVREVDGGSTAWVLCPTCEIPFTLRARRIRVLNLVPGPKVGTVTSNEWEAFTQKVCELAQ